MRKRVQIKGLMQVAAAAVAFGWALSAAAAAPQSQASQPDYIGNIQINQGAVMLSLDQQPFATATPDQRVADGERLMVTEGGSATVVYDNHCRQTYDKPGVYKLDRDCKAAILLPGGSETGVAAGTTGAAGGPTASGGLWTLAAVGTVAALGEIGGAINTHSHHRPVPPVSH